MHTDLESRLDARLRSFAAIDTAEEPYNYGGDSYPSLDRERKPSFPRLYLSRSKDKGLLKMQGEGQAVVNYKIKSRSVDEDSGADGTPLYGANIEIRSIEPIEGSEEDEAAEHGLQDTMWLREFAVKPRTVTKLMKTSKLNPLAIRKTGMGGEFRVAAKGASVKGPKGYFTDDIKDARGTAADLLRRKRAGQEVGFAEDSVLREFASPRDRDGEGRFASGNIPGADDYAIASATSKKKKAAVGGAAVLGAAALGGTAKGRALGSSLGRNALRIGKGLIGR